ncbi:hypothetical protein JWG42_18115, partial [Desulfoprunum benzoelyticum]
MILNQPRTVYKHILYTVTEVFIAYRNGNYAAFYVDEPFFEGNLGAHATKDFVSYNLLRAWKGSD